MIVNSAKAGDRIRLTACCDFYETTPPHRFSTALSLGRLRGGATAAARTDSASSGRRTRAGISAAEYPRIQAAVDAQGARAPGAARKISSDRFSRSPAESQRAGRREPGRRLDVAAQSSGDG